MPKAHGGTDNVNNAAFDAMFFKNYGVNPFVDTDEDNVYTVHEEAGRLAEAAAIIDGPNATAPDIQIELGDGLEEGIPAIMRE